MFLRNKFQVQIPDLGKEDFVSKEEVPKEEGRKTLFLGSKFLWLMFLRNRLHVQIPGLGWKTFFLRKIFQSEVFLRSRLQVQGSGFRV
ncbi:hypothetical protein PCOAH_00006710 [Plasmodium coatneyi]|uniref:SICA antigen n=1 Tax=Plasmodium coatneyi TaxID=208452 RepID=A0A1B1DUP1_9APIC|nr:hypothetical protein PCOAH_00006710 [Plasmodium coatneyi]ANQ06493.1 hypothetical protein PCOAH_00006710 [Plasmodium coatneyi]